MKAHSLLTEYNNHNKITLKYSISKISLELEILVPLVLSLVKMLKNQIDADPEIERKRGTKIILSIPFSVHENTPIHLHQ